MLIAFFVNGHDCLSLSVWVSVYNVDRCNLTVMMLIAASERSPMHTIVNVKIVEHFFIISIMIECVLLFTYLSNFQLGSITVFLCFVAAWRVSSFSIRMDLYVSMNETRCACFPRQTNSLMKGAGEFDTFAFVAVVCRYIRQYALSNNRSHKWQWAIVLWKSVLHRRKQWTFLLIHRNNIRTKGILNVSNFIAAPIFFSQVFHLKMSFSFHPFIGKKWEQFLEFSCETGKLQQHSLGEARQEEETRTWILNYIFVTQFVRLVIRIWITNRNMASVFYGRISAERFRHTISSND